MICAIDPGREKFGLAIVDGRDIVFSAVVPRAQLDSVASAIAAGDFSALADFVFEGKVPHSCVCLDIVLGDGTSSGDYYKVLTSHDIRPTMVDERGSTLEARGIYWRLHPPRFPISLIPTSWRVPPRPIDDLAAVVIAHRGDTNIS